MSGIIPASDNRSAAQWPPQSPGQRPYPEMPQVSDTKPLLQSLGATGVAIFSGIISSEEYNPDFYWRDGVKLYEQMLRSDGQIRAIRTVLENPIKRATWSIEPGSDAPRDKEIASFVESCLFHDMCYTTSEGRRKHQSWAQILHHVLMHLWYGFMAFEVNWRVEDGWVKWAKWEPLLPRTVWRWWVGRDTELVGIQQWTFKDYNYAFVDIPVDKLLLFVHQQEGANFEGLSLLRTAYKHWWYKSNFEKIEAIGIERNAVVPPVITLPENFTSADIAAAQTLGANMRASELGYATLPPGWLLEYPRGMVPFTTQVQPAIQYHDVMIARNVLAQFINLGSTETGAFALADAQQEMFLQALEAVTDYICDIISNDAIQRLVDYNFDNVAVYPKLRASKLANADITQVADALGKLKAREANFINPDPEMEDYLREQFGFPKAPKSVVQATNPTAESNAARPENANAQDHTDQQSAVQRVNPQTATNQSQVNAATNAIAPSAPGDGGALSERSEGLSQDVHLLAESLASIVGLDAVERGMTFFNPNHDPHSGEFASGGAGGAGEGAGKAAGSGRGGSKGSRSSAKASGKPATAKASGGGGAQSGGSKAESGSKATKTTAKAEKPAAEDIHARAARLQQEGHLAAEVKPGGELTPVPGGTEKVSAYEYAAHSAARANGDPFAGHTEAIGFLTVGGARTSEAGTRALAMLYGEHQLGAALSRETTESLRERAGHLGLATTGTKGALVSRITAHTTEGRYSANFGAKGSSKASPAEAHAAKAAKLKAALDKAQAAFDAHMATAPKLSEQSAHAREAARLLADVKRAQAALEQVDGKR